jgi:hypothetical protein
MSKVHKTRIIALERLLRNDAEQWYGTVNAEIADRLIWRLDALNKTGKKVSVWFRNDDVCMYDAALDNVICFFRSRRIPILLAVIPQRLVTAEAHAITSYEGVSIGQHGYSHINYVPPGGKCSELTDIRDVKTILIEQKRGREILKNAFGKSYVDIFIPPWFEIDNAIYEKLAGEGYAAFSIWHMNDCGMYGVPEINPQVDLVDWSSFEEDAWLSDEHFGGAEFAVRQFNAELDHLLKDSSLTEAAIGILLHHQRTGRDTLDFLDELLEILRSYPENVALCSAQTVAAFLKRSPANRPSARETDGT